MDLSLEAAVFKWRVFRRERDEARAEVARLRARVEELERKVMQHAP